MQYMCLMNEQTLTMTQMQFVWKHFKRWNSCLRFTYTYVVGINNSLVNCHSELSEKMTEPSQMLTGGLGIRKTYLDKGDKF